MVGLRLPRFLINAGASMLGAFGFDNRIGPGHPEQPDPIGISRFRELLKFRKRVPLLADNQASNHRMGRKKDGYDGRQERKALDPSHDPSKRVGTVLEPLIFSRGAGLASTQRSGPLLQPCAPTP